MKHLVTLVVGVVMATSTLATETNNRDACMQLKPLATTEELDWCEALLDQADQASEEEVENILSTLMVWATN